VSNADSELHEVSNNPNLFSVRKVNLWEMSAQTQKDQDSRLFLRFVDERTFVLMPLFTFGNHFVTSADIYLPIGQADSTGNPSLNKFKVMSTQHQINVESIKATQFYLRIRGVHKINYEPAEMRMYVLFNVCFWH
jgi:hypothetical protein